MDRINERDRPPDRRDDAADFFVVSGRAGCFHVTRETADTLIHQLARRQPPRWLAFVDLQGSRVRVRSRRIDAIEECSAIQREGKRAFHRALFREDRDDDRAWGDGA